MTQPLKQLWKQSSSLIILGKNHDVSKISNFNYKILVLERPSKSSYPGAIVFPGGVTETVDQVDDWLKFYRRFGVDDLKLKSITRNCSNSNRSFIFQSDSNERDSINKDISLRITAIRETFEELGILICKSKEQLKDSGLYSNLVHDFDVSFWQKEVYNDASNFLKLCELLNVVPDLWSLYEWSVWLTPTFKRPKRFETVFYLVGVKEQPKIDVVNDEVQQSLWQTPAELLEENRSGDKFWLAPPQFYELSRLANQPDIEKILSFAKHRAMDFPTTLMFPVNFHTCDGVISCYPGDDFYPTDPNYSTTAHDIEKYADKTIEECRAMAVNLHRAEQKSMRDVKIWHTVKSPDNHFNPQTPNNHTSKL